MVYTIQNKKEIVMDKILKNLIWLVIAVPAIYLLAIWETIPQTVPLHYNLKGEIDRLGSKNELIILVAVIMAVNIGVYFLLTNIHRIDPKKYAVENKGRLFRIAFVVTVFISAVICLMLYTSIHDVTKSFFRFIFVGVGLLFSIVGNYMYNIKPNYFAGFRLPWTLENEENWRKTHLLGGKIWFAGGLIIAVICLFTPLITSVITFSIIFIIMVIIPFVYSYRLYKKQTREKKAVSL